MSYQHILVAVDGSPTSDHAVAQATGLAQASGGRIRLLNVIDPVAHVSGFELPSVYSQEVLPRLQKAGEALLHRAQERVAERGVPVDTVLIENLDARVAQLVVEHAQTWGADLIVLGTHGRRGLERVLMGSDAEHIARTSPVPVLLVRLPAGANAAAAGA
ncbi:nucleotide-binding universal stress UspA family protein [Acidovorax sp. 69]|uniref:universal stress protein n=1 Tax=Acidovorax sp. 69 TaxID=2035202 RepID=UPI000C23BBA7|nr:universal stress protein [Acidovorax sp. 69]PJI95743.1 nucleotide-binding universal stress UspA family protein [Acidovorax sp. 69]